MKKKNLTSLALNKQKISELQTEKGGQNDSLGCITASTCSCVTCRPGFCPVGPSLLCTYECTMDCSIITCPVPTGYNIP